MSEVSLKKRYEDPDLKDVFAVLANLETLEEAIGKEAEQKGEDLTPAERAQLLEKMQKFVVFCNDFAAADHSARAEVENIPVQGKYGTGAADLIASAGITALQSTVGGIVDSRGETIALALQDEGMDVTIPELAGVDPVVRGFEDAVANILYKNAIQDGHDYDEVLPEEVKAEIHAARRIVTKGRDTGPEDFKSPADMKDARFSDMTLWNRLGQYVMDTDTDRSNHKDHYITFGRKGFKSGAAFFDRFRTNRRAARRDLMCKGAALQAVESMYPEADATQKDAMVRRVAKILQKAGSPSVSGVTTPLFRDFIYCVADPSKDVARDPKMHAMHEHPIVKQMVVLAGQSFQLQAPAADAVQAELAAFGLEASDVELTPASVTKAMEKSSTKWGRDNIVEAVGMAVCLKLVDEVAGSLEKELNGDRTFQEGRQVTTQFQLSSLERRKLAEELLNQMHQSVQRDGQEGDKPSMTPQELLNKLNVGVFKGKSGADYLGEAIRAHLMEKFSHVRQYARVGFTDSKVRDRSYMPFADSKLHEVAKDAFKNFADDVQVVRGVLTGAKKEHVANSVARRADLPGTPTARAATRGYALELATKIVDDTIDNIRGGLNHPLRRKDGPAVPAPKFDLQSTVRRLQIEEVANHILEVHNEAGTKVDLELAVAESKYAEKLEASLVRETYASRANDVNMKLKFAHYGNFREGKLEKIYPSYRLSGREEIGTLQSGPLDKVLECVKRSYDKEVVARPYYGPASAGTVISEAIDRAGSKMPNIAPEVRRELAEALATHLDSIGKNGRELSVDQVVTALNAPGAGGKSAMDRLAAMPQRTDKAAITKSSLSGHEVDGKSGSVFNRRGHIYENIFADLQDQAITSIDLKIVKAQVSKGVNKLLQTKVADEMNHTGSIEGMSGGLSDLVQESVTEYFEQDSRRIQAKDVTKVINAVATVLMTGVDDVSPDFARSHGFLGSKNPHLASRRTYGDNPMALKDALKEKIGIAMEGPFEEPVQVQLMNVPDTKETLAEKSNEAKLAKKEAKAAAAAQKASQAEAASEVKSSWMQRFKRLFSKSDKPIVTQYGITEESVSSARGTETGHPSPVHAAAAEVAKGLSGVSSADTTSPIPGRGVAGTGRGVSGS